MRSRVAGPSTRGLAAVVVALGAMSWASSAAAAGTFGNRKAITFNGGATGVSGGPHASFPVLVSLVDVDLQGRVVSPSGFDILFRGESPATCGGVQATCSLDHEIERWDAATGTLVAWVRVPSLAAGTTIYMYYGNKDVTAPTEAPRAVWDAGYVAVWHLDEPGSGNVNEYRDSSRYGNHGRGGQGALPATPTRVPDGPIGYGQHFGNADGRYDLIDGGDDGTLRMTGNRITLEAWVRHNITIGGGHDPYGILNLKGYYDGYRLALSGSSFACGGAITAPCLTFGLPGATDLLRTPQNPPFLTPNQWHHVVATYDGSQMGVFVDGVNQGWRTKTGNISPSVGGEPVWIGHADQPENQPWSGQFEGDIDEVRISRVARSTNWIATQFNNQRSPGAFYTVGTQAEGAFSPATLAVHYRSIGANAGDLYTTGTASVAVGATTVTFAGASLPMNLGTGDVLTFTGAPTETVYVLSRDSDTQLTLQAPATADHVGQSYTIKRAYNSLAAWEAGRQGDLVAENRREIGVAYADGPLAGVTIDGSTTDPAHDITLTVARGQRHLGRAGTGVVLDNSGGLFPAIQILDDFVTVEWLEIRGGNSPGGHGIDLAGGIGPANLVTVANNLVHDTAADGVHVGDPDAVVDVRNNVVYRAAYGIHFPVDMAADARVNVFNNTIYDCAAATGPSGVRSDVRQTSLRIDLRNNIAHSNASGDFGVSPFFDSGYFCNPGCTQIANGGVLGPNEYLADRNNDFLLSFTTVSQSCLYLGSAWKFRGVNPAVATGGIAGGGGVDLAWSYWNGTTWASLETGPFNDGSGNFVWEGTAYWPDDPAGWAMRTFSGSPSLYYVRACLASGGYSTLPVEAAITRVDVAIASRDNLASDITGGPHSAIWGGQTGLDSVSLAGVAFVDPMAPDLHILPGSAAVDAAVDLGHDFSGDIDGASRPAPWDIGADEALAGSGPDLAIAKVRTSPPPVVPGGGVSYRVTVTNNGPGTLTSVTVTDALPAEIRFPAFTPSLGSYDPATGLWSGVNLAPLQSVTLDLAGTVAPSARGTLVNGARVEPPAGVADPNPSNDSASASDLLSPSADLHLTKAADPEPAADLGGLLKYTLTVRNDGPSAATGVTLTDPLPPPTEFDSVTSSQGTCSFDLPTRVLTCALGDVPCPGIATVTLTVRPMAVGTLTNTASVDGLEPDPDSTDDTATVPTTVEVPTDGVTFFTVTSTSEMNVLEWLNPTANFAATEILVRTDRFPTAPGEPGTSQVYYGGTAGAKVRHPHPTGLGSNGQTFYYAAFVHLTPAPGLSAGRFVRGRPFDVSGDVKWAFSTGGFSVTPPTVGGAGVIATSNDMAVHAMARGATSPPGGEWPTGWLPFRVSGPVQSRPPVVPITVNAASPVVFLGSQDGRVYSLDGGLGGNAAVPWPEYAVGQAVQAAPAGLFKDFGADYDYLLVGTRDTAADNALVAVDPLTGGFLASFTNGGGANGIGIVNGMASVDYLKPPHVYFTSHARAAGGPTLWCQELTATPAVFASCTGWTHAALGDIDCSPVIRGGRVYVGSGSGGGTVYSVDAASGAADRSFVHDDGQVKGFVFPDRGSDVIYFATDNRVWSFSDTTSGLSENFSPGGISLDGARPSAVLFVPGSRYLYVGASNGRLYEIDTATGTYTWEELGDGKAVVGAPSLDRETSLVHVGTEAGVFYAVSVPLSP